MGLTLKDVAKEVGVSYATVSRVLNNHPDVSEITKKKVLRKVKEMGYKPNALARGLVKNETNTIGLIIPDITNPFFPEVARGVEEAAAEAGFSVFLCNTNWNEDREEKYIDVLLQKQVDGLIVAPSSERPRHLTKINNSNLKMVYITRLVDEGNSTSVTIDNVRGAEMAVEHLISCGHKKIAFIGGFQDMEATRERFEGFQNAMRKHNIDINNEYIRSGEFKRETGYTLMNEMLDSDLQLTAVFTVNDMLALGAMQAIKNRRLSIPKDIAVIGFDDIEFASLPEIQLSTISQPKHEMGVIAFNTLLDQINNKTPLAQKKILLAPKLIIRETS